MGDFQHRGAALIFPVRHLQHDIVAGRWESPARGEVCIPTHSRLHVLQETSLSGHVLARNQMVFGNTAMVQKKVVAHCVRPINGKLKRQSACPQRVRD